MPTGKASDPVQHRVMGIAAVERGEVEAAALRPGDGAEARLEVFARGDVETGEPGQQQAPEQAGQAGLVAEVDEVERSWASDAVTAASQSGIIERPKEITIRSKPLRLNRLSPSKVQASACARQADRPSVASAERSISREMSSPKSSRPG